MMLDPPDLIVMIPKSKKPKNVDTLRGTSFPLGATVTEKGVNFSIYSKSADHVDLLLFDKATDIKPFRTVHLSSKKNKTYHYWHAFVADITAGQIYGFHVHGPNKPELGLRFDPEKLLLDPYAKSVVVPETYSRLLASQPGDNCGSAMKSVVLDPNVYDWEGDVSPKRPFSRTIIYEMHVRGFTAHPSSGVAAEKRGTYAGMIEKIPYLVDLGITAVELLPIFHFDEQDAPNHKNYWGYQPISYFAPHPGYSFRKDPLGPADEFRDLVKALHKAGLEVILDVVYNHTTEGDHNGPTLSFRGLENPSYYILESNKELYSNFSGCGNTLDASNPFVRRLIIDSLRYWVEEMHVDGFRFDLASILSRDNTGNPVENPPVLWDIETDPVLAGVKLIAEAWDAAGLYQVGTFVGDSWKEWNGKFRDDVRSFLKGDNDSVSKFAKRILGSPDIYGHEEREPEQSINFVTCHDGFTLNDLVSYNYKHNEINGEDNRDGSNDNVSWNCGVEGPTDNLEVEQLRKKQIKNFLSILFLSTGAPMLLMGDESRNTQNGNNNAYGQDNEISWIDWTLIHKHQDIYRFVKCLIAARLHSDLSLENPNISLNQFIRNAQIKWHGVKLDQPDWGPDSHSIALTARSLRGRFAIHLMVNAYWEELQFTVPSTRALSANQWRRWIDTSQQSPEDIYSTWEDAPVVNESSFVVQPRSFVALFTRINKAGGNHAGT
jgi:glycogen operon protein